MANCFLFRAFAIAGGLCVLLPDGAAAQIMGGWSRPVPPPPPATIPLPGTVETVAPVPAIKLEPQPVTVSPHLPALSRASTGDAALPVVMFRARPAPDLPPSLPPVPPLEAMAQAAVSEPVLSEADWARLQSDELIVDQPVTRAARRLREPRGPWTRIYQDSRRAIVQDMPEALADSLPWVDRDLKDETLDTVLVRVSDELARARDHDPEWAEAAERELRALDARLARLPEPPDGEGGIVSAGRVGNPPAAHTGPTARNARPFRPRPIWPGASATTEPQIRPPTLTTDGIEETGPSTSGVATMWQVPEDLAGETAGDAGRALASQPGPGQQGRGRRRP
ncbi:MAG: hypothetical protein MUF14_11415 [Hyphomonadaceae bacterium]|jgi:hypothetical protein|nr:hypothetical protein [Hyphomonadaceae bacterium]